MVVDLILLIIITSVFFIFLSQQTGHIALEAETIRSQNSYMRSLLSATLNYKINSTYQNATVAEAISAYHCNLNVDKSTLANITRSIVENLSKKNYYFILTSEASDAPFKNFGVCSKFIEENYSCCVKIEKITLSTVNIDLPCNSTAKITFGAFPDSIEVKKC